MKTIIFPTQEAVFAAAEHILAQIRKNKSAVIALSAGEDELRVWERVVLRAREERISLSELVFLAACEFEELPAGEKGGVGQRLRDTILAASDASAEGLFIPDAAEPSAFDELIKRLGGIDLAVLGLGENARVAFNEPATQYDTHTHVQRLTDRTKRELAPLFGGEDSVPPRGVTMGFRELCAVRELLVIALGESKSKALFHMLYARDDSVYPAAFLQLPPNVTVYADDAAASRLEGKSFDAVAFNSD